MTEPNSCQMGECPNGNPHCEGCETDDSIWVIWWTTQADCELMLAIWRDAVGIRNPDAPEPDSLMPEDWPAWLGEQLCSRWGRAGRARLWNAFPGDWLPGGINPWPQTALARRIAGEDGDPDDAGGIVMPLGCLHHVIGLPGLVTNAQLVPLLVHGVDIDL